MGFRFCASLFAKPRKCDSVRVHLWFFVQYKVLDRGSHSFKKLKKPLNKDLLYSN